MHIQNNLRETTLFTVKNNIIFVCILVHQKAVGRVTVIVHWLNFFLLKKTHTRNLINMHRFEERMKTNSNRIRWNQQGQFFIIWLDICHAWLRANQKCNLMHFESKTTKLIFIWISNTRKKCSVYHNISNFLLKFHSIPIRIWNESHH